MIFNHHRSNTEAKISAPQTKKQWMCLVLSVLSLIFSCFLALHEDHFIPQALAFALIGFWFLSLLINPVKTTNHEGKVYLFHPRVLFRLRALIFTSACGAWFYISEKQPLYALLCLSIVALGLFAIKKKLSRAPND